MVDFGAVGAEVAEHLSGADLEREVEDAALLAVGFVTPSSAIAATMRPLSQRRLLVRIGPVEDRRRGREPGARVDALRGVVSGRQHAEAQRRRTPRARRPP